MCSERSHGPVNEGPKSADSARQEGCVLILGLRDDAVSFKGSFTMPAPLTASRSATEPRPRETRVHQGEKAS